MVGIARGGQRLTRVLIVGDVIDDIVVTPLGHVTRDSDTTSRILVTPGGSAANQAAWLAVSGVHVRFVARVGAADVARHGAELAAFGVDAELIADSDAPTGTIVVMLDADGSRTMYTDRGANQHLNAADLPLSLLEGVDMLHVNGYALFSESPRSAVVALIDEARRRGIAVTADPSSSAYLEELGASTFLACTRGAAVCLPNLDEGRVLTGKTEPRDVLGSLLERYAVVALKLGHEGVLVGEGKSVELIPAVSSSAIDPTGAGDAFCAGFLASWLDGDSAVDAATAGSLLAARAVAAQGGRPPVERGGIGAVAAMPYEVRTPSPTKGRAKGAADSADGRGGDEMRG
jgi:sugar/nucleoside kinase (ribokinase family)